MGMTHKWVGPKGVYDNSSIAEAFRGVCTCSWVGDPQSTRRLARVDHSRHVKEIPVERDRPVDAARIARAAHQFDTWADGGREVATDKGTALLLHAVARMLDDHKSGRRVFVHDVGKAAMALAVEVTDE